MKETLSVVALLRAFLAGVSGGLVVGGGLLGLLMLSPGLPQFFRYVEYCAASGALAAGIVAGRRLGRGGLAVRLAGLWAGLLVGVGLMVLVEKIAFWANYVFVPRLGFQVALFALCGFLGPGLALRRKRQETQAWLSARRDRREGDQL